MARFPFSKCTVMNFTYLLLGTFRLFPGFFHLGHTEESIQMRAKDQEASRRQLPKQIPHLGTSGQAAGPWQLPADLEGGFIVPLGSQLPGPPVCVRMFVFVFSEVPTSKSRNCSGTHLLTHGAIELPRCWRVAGPQETRSNQNLCPGMKGCPSGLAGAKESGRQASSLGAQGRTQAHTRGPFTWVSVGSPHQDRGF